MPFLSDAYITAVLGGAVTGAPKYAAMGDPSARAAWILRADAAVVAAASRGGYSGVTSDGPVPATGAAYEVLRALAFDEWSIIANWYGREIKLGEFGAPSSVLYATAGEGRIDLPGIGRDQIGGAAGGDITNVSSLSTSTAAPIFTRAALEGNGFC